ncbi:cobalamin B12-binding domain-containing protein [Candidatus Omnitrophota bacterium]
MKITLIYVQTIELNNLLPPLGLMYVAAVARDAGHKVQLLDVDPDEIDVVEKVSAFTPDLIGLSFLTTEFEKARFLSHKLKKAFPNAKLCCGGAHTTVDTESVLRQFNVDFCEVWSKRCLFYG